MRLRSTDCRPSVGSTRDDWITVSETGSAPELMRLDRSFADATVKLPEICPDPEVKTFWITGAEICLPSSVIWTGWFRKSFDSWIHRLASSPVNSK